MVQVVNYTRSAPLDTYETERLSPEAYEKYWPFVSQQLDCVPHIWEKWYTKEWLRLAPAQGMVEVWGVGPTEQIRLFVYSMIITYPACRILNVFLALGNDAPACMPSLIAALEKYANDTQCDHCDVIGRKGWEKFLPGFKQTSVVFSRPVQHFKVQ